jgi:hypothetical protein
MINATSRRAEIVVILVALALPFKAGGCGTTTCITLSQAQIKSGTCPSAEEAQARVADPSMCSFGATSTTIEGEGVLDGELCCYPSTKQVGGGCFGGGVGGGFTMSSAFGGSGAVTGGPPPGCAPCRNALNGTPFDQVCSTDLQNLEMCGCTACTAACDPTLCIGNAPDDGCLGCLQTSCTSQLTACQQN